MSTATLTRLTIDRKALVDAHGRVAGVIPARSPKPSLLNCLLRIDGDGLGTLTATDLESSVVTPVSGVESDGAASVLLSARAWAAMKSLSDEAVTLEVSDGALTIRGLRSRFAIPTDDPDLFPTVSGWGDPQAYRVVGADELKRAIRLTVTATDIESTRYALGGVCFESDGGTLNLIGTDGRRLAWYRLDSSVAGDPVAAGAPVVPVKALKLIERLLDAGEVVIDLTDKAATFKLSDGSVVSSRLVEGRFPKWRDVMPGERAARVTVGVGALLSGLTQAAITTSEESRGIDLTWKSDGTLTLAGRAADAGESSVEVETEHDGPDVEVTLDPRYVADTLKSLDAGEAATVDLIDHKNAVVVRDASGSLVLVCMPLTKEGR